MIFITLDIKHELAESLDTSDVHNMVAIVESQASVAFAEEQSGIEVRVNLLPAYAEIDADVFVTVEVDEPSWHHHFNAKVLAERFADQYGETLESIVQDLTLKVWVKRVPGMVASYG